MLFKVFNEMFEQFPKLNIGIVVAKNISNKGSDKKIFGLFEDVENLIKMDFVPEKMISVNYIKKHIAKHKLISAWRAAYEDLGYVKKYHTSAEAMMIRILSGEKVSGKNKLADIANYLSLKHIVPVGCDDLDKVQGDIFLGLATGEETFIDPDTGEYDNPDKNEVIYFDAEGALARRWNWKETKRTEITEKTKNAIFYVDGLQPITREKLEAILKELADLIMMFCSGEVNYSIVNEKNTPIKF